jgi:4-hydroxy-tetrahydrodipicolinate synthase
MSSEHLLKTVTVPIITGFADTGRPDPSAVTGLLQNLAANRITTVLLFGSNGEGSAVATKDIGWYSRAVAERWREFGGASARTLIAVTGASTSDMLARADEALSAAPDALIAAPPFYFHHTREEIVAHYRELEAIGMPWVAYNVPRYTGNPLTLDVLGAIGGWPNCLGVKDSSGDEATLLGAIELAARRPDFQVSQGSETHLASALAAGAAGITPGLANLAPGACVDLFDAAVAGDTDTAQELQLALTRLAGIHSVRPGVVAMKTALALVGLASSKPSLPFVAYNADETDRLGQILRQCQDVHRLPVFVHK